MDIERGRLAWGDSTSRRLLRWFRSHVLLKLRKEGICQRTSHVQCAGVNYIKRGNVLRLKTMKGSLGVQYGSYVIFVRRSGPSQKLIGPILNRLRIVLSRPSSVVHLLLHVSCLSVSSSSSSGVSISSAVAASSVSSTSSTFGGTSLLASLVQCMKLFYKDSSSKAFSMPS